MNRPPTRTPRIVVILVIAATVGVVWLAKILARHLAWDPGLTALGALLALSALMSLALSVQRLLLRKKLRTLDPRTIRALASQSEDIKYAFPSPASRPIWLIVALGVLFVNLPTLPLLVGPIALLQFALAPEPPVPQLAALLLGFVVAWSWWSWTAPAWRRWAEHQGLSSGEVQYHGERASILWPKGHFLARTERRGTCNDDA